VSIVDDDESVRAATTTLLTLHGFAVRAFASAEAFLRSEDIGATRCLIADVKMPGMSGLALQDRLAAEGRRIPTIVVTAYPDDRSREHAVDAGALCFLTKPFDVNVLIHHVEEAMRSGGQ
jgi:FixJ family two-component response regulator